MKYSYWLTVILYVSLFSVGFSYADDKLTLYDRNKAKLEYQRSNRDNNNYNYNNNNNSKGQNYYYNGRNYYYDDYYYYPEQ